MARQLIESLAADFEPDKFKDTYREAVLELIERKAAGEEVVASGSQSSRPRSSTSWPPSRRRWRRPRRPGPAIPRPTMPTRPRTARSRRTKAVRKARKAPAKKAPAKKATARRKSA